MQREHAGGRRLLGPGADPADVRGVAQADHGDAVLSRPLDAERDRLPGDHLAVALLAVDRDQRAAVMHDPGLAVGAHAALLQKLEVRKNPDHAVGIVADQVGVDQMLGDRLRLVQVRAGVPEDADDEALQRPGGDPHDDAPCCAVGQLRFGRAAARRSASSIASSMLCGLAMPRPAMSNAVP